MQTGTIKWSATRGCRKEL